MNLTLGTIPIWNLTTDGTDFTDKKGKETESWLQNYAAAIYAMLARDGVAVDADEDGIGGDDAADALRYLVATKDREIRMVKLKGW